jgi:hypothetical protein
MSTQYLGPKYTPLPRGLWEIAQKEKKKMKRIQALSLVGVVSCAVARPIAGH